MKKFFKIFSFITILIFVSLTHCFADVIVNNPRVIQQIIEVTDLNNKNFLDICRINGVSSENLKVDTKRITFYLDTKEPCKVVFGVPIIDPNNDIIGVAEMPFGYSGVIRKQDILDFFSLKNPTVNLRLLHINYEDEYCVYGTNNPIKYDACKIKSMLEFGKFDLIYYSREYDDDDSFGDLVLNHEIRSAPQQTIRIDKYFVAINEIVPLQQTISKSKSVFKKSLPTLPHKPIGNIYPPCCDFSKLFSRKIKIIRPIFPNKTKLKNLLLD